MQSSGLCRLVRPYYTYLSRAYLQPTDWPNPQIFALSKFGVSELNSVFSNLNKYFISSWDT